MCDKDSIDNKRALFVDDTGCEMRTGLKEVVTGIVNAV